MTNLVSFQESSDGSTHIIIKKKKLYQSHRLKDRNHIISSLDTEKVYDKNSSSFNDEVTGRLGMEGIYHHIVRILQP